MNKWSSQFSESLIQLLMYLKTYGSSQFFTRIIFNPSSRIKGICFVYFSLISLVVFLFFFCRYKQHKTFYCRLEQLMSIGDWYNWKAIGTKTKPITNLEFPIEFWSKSNFPAFIQFIKKSIFKHWPNKICAIIAFHIFFIVVRINASCSWISFFFLVNSTTF